MIFLLYVLDANMRAPLKHKLTTHCSTNLWRTEHHRTKCICIAMVFVASIPGFALKEHCMQRTTNKIMCEFDDQTRAMRWDRPKCALHILRGRHAIWWSFVVLSVSHCVAGSISVTFSGQLHLLLGARWTTTFHHPHPGRTHREGACNSHYCLRNSNDPQHLNERLCLIIKRVAQKAT